MVRHRTFFSYIKTSQPDADGRKDSMPEVEEMVVQSMGGFTVSVPRGKIATIPLGEVPATASFELAMTVNFLRSGCPLVQIVLLMIEEDHRESETNELRARFDHLANDKERFVVRRREFSSVCEVRLLEVQ